jgi:hypothetical protein
MTTVDELRDVLQGQRTRVADLRERVQDKYLRDGPASSPSWPPLSAEPIEYVTHVEDMQEVPAARAYLENLLASPLLLRSADKETLPMKRTLIAIAT